MTHNVKSKAEIQTLVHLVLDFTEFSFQEELRAEGLLPRLTPCPWALSACRFFYEARLLGCLRDGSDLRRSNLSPLFLLFVQLCSAGEQLRIKLPLLLVSCKSSSCETGKLGRVRSQTKQRFVTNGLLVRPEIKPPLWTCQVVFGRLVVMLFEHLRLKQRVVPWGQHHLAVETVWTAVCALPPDVRKGCAKAAPFRQD